MYRDRTGKCRPWGPSRGGPVGGENCHWQEARTHGESDQGGKVVAMIYAGCKTTSLCNTQRSASAHAFQVGDLTELHDPSIPRPEQESYRKWFGILVHMDVTAAILGRERREEVGVVLVAERDAVDGE